MLFALGIALFGYLVGVVLGAAQTVLEFAVGERLAVGADAYPGAVGACRDARAVAAYKGLGAVGPRGVAGAILADEDGAAVGGGGEPSPVLSSVGAASVGPCRDAEAVLADDDAAAVRAGGDAYTVFADDDAGSAGVSYREGRRRRRSWGEGRDGGLLERDVCLRGREADKRSTLADGSAEVLAVVAALGREGEVVLEVAVGGFGLNCEAGLLGNRDIDGAVAILDGDVAERRCAGHVDGAVAVG